ncbi:hypothetical protein M422DRAFT_261467 [Sphaerobolus stellatus SS14]|uniref:Uncharacterized protein n=1 Tax=Sphaerobolus stellatus (strain SS14) TaxID=990650 RepID=A0A0C9VET0_SPHS4|nr:hypothetical protein M422DRAFT_261467 [Sphaerobolus stellatus SS14]
MSFQMDEAEAIENDDTEALIAGSASTTQTIFDRNERQQLKPSITVETPTPPQTPIHCTHYDTELLDEDNATRFQQVLNFLKEYNNAGNSEALGNVTSILHKEPVMITVTQVNK